MIFKTCSVFLRIFDLYLSNVIIIQFWDFSNFIKFHPFFLHTVWLFIISRIGGENLIAFLIIYSRSVKMASRVTSQVPLWGLFIHSRWNSKTKPKNLQFIKWRLLTKLLEKIHFIKFTRFNCFIHNHKTEINGRQ